MAATPAFEVSPLLMCGAQVGGLQHGSGYGKLIEEYIYFLRAKLAFHRQHPEFNGTFEYEEYISLKSINDPNEG